MTENFKGYLSEEAKKKFTIIAGVLGGIFFIAQMILPALSFLAIVPISAINSSLGFKFAQVERSVLWNNTLWYPEYSVPFGANSQRNLVLKKLPLAEKSNPIEVAALALQNPGLLADTDGFWIFDVGKTGRFKDGTIKITEWKEKIGNFSHPFYYLGKAAIIEENPEGYLLKVWENDTWKKIGDFRVVVLGMPGSIMEYLQVVAQGENIFFFIKS